MSRSFVSQVERGLARPSMRSLSKLADALGTTAHLLMALPEGRSCSGTARFRHGPAHRPQFRVGSEPGSLEPRDAARRVPFRTLKLRGLLRP
ncbi:MAG: helix-turn-helix domain-containing protein [Frankia sp.]